MRTSSHGPLVGREISRFPSKERPHMPGSSTTPGRPGTRDSAPVRVVFRDLKRVDTQRYTYFAAQWLACALPCRRFALILADEDARLGAEVGAYAFLVMDLPHLLPAGLSRRTQIKYQLPQFIGSGDFYWMFDVAKMLKQGLGETAA